MTIEECLREIRARAALVRYLASSAVVNDERPDPEVLTGVWTVCEEIETLTASVNRTLTAVVLNAEIRRIR